ncbi:MAG: hypothetical protein CMN76_20130 [Spirochaetaceae bacterium]|nr:hypothetical protein [Spirochaetaceae bacterium]
MYRRKLRYSHQKRNCSIWKMGILCLVLFSGASGYGRPRPGSPVSIPEPEDHIVDPARFLEPATRQRVNSRLGRLFRQYDWYIFVVLVDSTTPETISEFSLRAYRTLTRRIFAREMVIAIEVNRKRSAITASNDVDPEFRSALQHIAIDHINPALRSANIEQALDASIRNVEMLLQNEESISSQSSDNPMQESSGVAFVGLLLLGLGLFLCYMASRMLLFIVLMISPVAFILFLFGTGLFTHSFLLTGIVALFLGTTLGRSIGSASGVSVSGSGFGGGFSGGGGSFGGGGASGGW